MAITFENLPEAVNLLFNKVELIEQFIMEEANKEQAPKDELLTVPQAAEFLNLAKSSLYGLIHRKAIPNMKRGKKVYFSKEELINYLQGGTRLSLDQLKEERKNLSFTKKRA